MPFQQQYAGLILELERLNKDLNEYLLGVQHYCAEVDFAFNILGTSLSAETYLLSVLLILRTSEDGIPALSKLPCGVARWYTGFTQTSLWHQKPVYQQHGMSTPGVGRRNTGFVF